MYYIRENNDLDRHFKKRYCHCCGRELETQWVEKPIKEQYIEIFGERYYYISAFGKWCFYDDTLISDIISFPYMGIKCVLMTVR